VIKFDHMSLPVRDPARSRNWYVGNFGFEIEFEDEETIAIRDDADFTIFLFKAPAAIAGVRPTLTFQVDDVDAKYASLRSLGVAFAEAPGKHFWGYGAELDDPDGYRIYLWDETSMREKG
jgi:catechol 2,3-dioxygenase-like lactoylglutathione lyase family enzyme